jgi:hypothetical protein
VLSSKRALPTSVEYAKPVAASSATVAATLVGESAICR